MIRTIPSLALACSLALTATAVAAEDLYPRIGAVPISSPHDYYTTTYQQQLAKSAVSVLAIYPGWGSQMTMDNVAKNVKKLNPNSKVFVYVIAESLGSPASPAWTVLENKVNTERWWLYTSGTTKVLSDFGHEMYVLNISSLARKDSSGRAFGPWFAQYVVDQFIKPNPTLDGIYSDNVFWKPRRDGDWNGDGKIDSQNDPVVQGWYRQGYRNYANALRAAMPGKMLIGNIADWGQPSAVLTEYQGLFNGGVIEAVIGKTYSIENYGGWGAMMTAYRKTMAALAAPKLAIFQIYGKLTDYQTMRYGLASCLLDNGYYSFNDEDHQNYGVPWFDEFDAKLGAPLDAPVTKAWQNGVYRRNFTNGIVLVNPKGNGAKEVTLEAEFVKLKGAQAPTVNNGQTVTKVTLNDRDGIILMRKSPLQRPAAPAGVTVESSG